jgi:hypothetical protein
METRKNKTLVNHVWENIQRSSRYKVKSVTGSMEGRGVWIRSSHLSQSQAEPAESLLSAAGFPKTLRHLGKSTSDQPWLYIRDGWQDFSHWITFTCHLLPHGLVYCASFWWTHRSSKSLSRRQNESPSGEKFLVQDECFPRWSFIRK